MTRFQDDQYYPTTAPELALLGTRGTLAIWRHEGRGPTYCKIGSRVFYLGRDLNEWIDAHRDLASGGR